MSVFLKIMTSLSIALIGACGFLAADLSAFWEMNPDSRKRRLNDFFSEFSRGTSTVHKIILPVTGAAMALSCGRIYGINTASLTVFAFLSVLAAVTLVDAGISEIPNGYCIAVALLGVASVFILPDITPLEHIIGIFASSVPLLLITLAVPGGFGGGDIKLMAACGLFLGWKLILLSTFIGIIIGGIYGANLMLTKKKRGSDHFAFGPCLCIGMAACCFFGGELLSFFVNIFDFSKYLF